MDAATFLQKFELLADAPGGVPRLRGMVLDLAARGKLSQRKQDDGTADDLLAKIAERREDMIANGLGKKEKSIPAVDSGPFDTPETWRWASIAAVTCYVQRGKGPKYADRSDVPVVSQKCVQWSGFDIARARFVDPESLKTYGSERFLLSGDLLWNSTGTGTIGRVNVLPDLRAEHPRLVADSHVTVLRPVVLDPLFLWCWLASPTVQNTIDDISTGTTKQKELGTGTVKAHVVPLAPLAEQKRIVAKVDQLLALCDELEEKQKKRHETRTHLNNACLDHLLTSEAAREFEEHWGTDRSQLR